MPTLGDMPEKIKELYSKYLAEVERLKKYMEVIASSHKIKARRNILKEFSEHYIYIKKGDFKLILDNKIVRIYSEGELIFASKNLANTSKILSEYSAEVLVVGCEMFDSVLQGEAEALQAFRAVESSSALLDLYLIAHYQNAIKRPDLGTRNYEAGDKIINEGDDSDEIYEMLDGSAKVFVGGEEVGEIHESEIFGELSFFIGEKRTADVIASKPCTVNYINRSDFMELIKHRPQLIYNIAQNLAIRLSEKNK